MPEPRAVVLDVDGTLVDAVYDHTFAWTRAFRRAGHPVDTWLIHRHIGMGGDRRVAAVADQEVEDESGDLIRELWEGERSTSGRATCSPISTSGSRSRSEFARARLARS